MNKYQIKKTILEIIEKQCSDKKTQNGQTGGILQEVKKQLNLPYGDDEQEQAVLTVWNDLFRVGYLAWGLNFSNPAPPFFHVTEKGRSALKHVSRDPSNADGYIHYIEKNAILTDVTKSYLKEALETYNSNNYKAVAVMVGCAAESIILEIAQILIQKYTELGQTPPNKLNNWQIKRVLSVLKQFFDGQNGLPLVLWTHS